VSASGGNRGRLYIIRREEPQHAGHHGGSWKVAYADFVTALMALFLLLWLLMALKPQQKESLAVYFQDPTSWAEHADKGVPIPTQGAKSDVLHTTTQQQVMKTLAGQLQELVSKDPELDKAAKVSQDHSGVSIRISSGLAFEQGSAHMTQRMHRVLQEIADVLRTQNVTLEVRGHSDDAEPVHAPYRSRWELSSARAAAVVSTLATTHGVKAERLTAIGCAETQPLLPNDTEANRARNRRVEFFFSPAENP